MINVKKKDQFPLAEPLVVDANHPEQIQLEAPLLIDPTTDDARLVSYEMDEDACIATAVLGADELETKRVNATIDVLGLNRLDRLPMESTPQLLGDIRQLIEGARQQASVALNACQTALYWHIGRRIHTELLAGERAAYGAQIVATVSRQLVHEFGRG